MTDPRSSDIGDTGSEARRGSPPPMPRWVKVVGLVILVAALVLVALLLLVGGEHGPARHAQAGHSGGVVPAAAASISG
jgi:hypothetical protein